MDAEFKPRIKFDDQSESFTLGFEVGSPYSELMLARQGSLTAVDEGVRVVHTKNIPLLKSIARAFKFDTIVTASDVDDWSFIELNPSGLKLLKGGA